MKMMMMLLLLLLRMMMMLLLLLSITVEHIETVSRTFLMELFQDQRHR